MQASTDWLQRLIASRCPDHSLPRAFYCDDTVLAADLERLFGRCWLFAGHACQVARAGEYFLYDVGRESLIILRGDDGELRAFFNVCRHRGSRVCTAPSGRAKKLVCPYHQWAYDHSGALLAARGMGPDFAPGQYGLRPAHVRELQGLIYVCLAHQPPPFEAALREVGAQLAPHGLERAKICCTREYEVRANWKLIFENNRECYHCPVGHPEYCRANYAEDLSHHENRRQELELLTAAQEARWRALGLSTKFVDFQPATWFLCGRVPLRPGFVSESLDGRPVAPLMGDLPDRDIGVFVLVTFPNCWVQASSDYVMTTRLTPVSPTLTKVRVDWLVHEEAVPERDYNIEEVTAFWGATSAQDWRLCEDNQAGVLSSRYEPGPYSPNQERGVETFVRWYLRQLSMRPWEYDVHSGND